MSLEYEPSSQTVSHYCEAIILKPSLGLQELVRRKGLKVKHEKQKACGLISWGLRVAGIQRTAHNLRGE
jgi:hypothetical protein